VRRRLNKDDPFYYDHLLVLFLKGKLKSEEMTVTERRIVHSMVLFRAIRELKPWKRTAA